MMKGLTYDAGASAYDRFTGCWSRAFVPRLLTAGGVTAGQTILEVAAGTGGLTVMAASTVGPSGRVIASDPSLSMLRVAQDKSAGTARTARCGADAGRGGGEGTHSSDGPIRHGDVALISSISP